MSKLHLATFGGGCFWCIDAAFRKVKGVTAVTSGYSGGDTLNPTYKEICSGTTRHAEVVQLEFDAELIAFETLLEMFFTLHDPTQLNRQGNDIGTQYRSVIFYHTDEQQALAKAHICAIQAHYEASIVTELSAAEIFYDAEQYHQNYFDENPNQGYCSIMIAPKVAKFEQRFSDYLK
ncbi:peptide-methionine (S)-S-oxide reductase MsrA [Pseudoalteromonas luteoviolacea]|uniref:peptide-methionine (S)-S-oxide reductase MsrA n=1 Tax=Pseudoalteromonas luteoviolacea TaxID=43657 RepID=UPI001B36984D|nr:peptide-methionine (S)-S-oxide reductase MsrA [Pseudoalteromonas luteoviolacea]MBQ4838336.1 peptide-methionine (S)-S-oxide reductase MsrA [Pseudoalteromonas luteoviolacea]